MAERREHGATLVVGLGNPILGDDGVGWRVIDVVERRVGGDAAADLVPGALELDRLCVGGLALMERVVGYERVVIVDAAVGDGPVGAVWAAPLASVMSDRMGHLDSSHDASLAIAFGAARQLGARLPDRVTVVAIVIEPSATFGEGLSPEVERAVPMAAGLVLEALDDAAASADAATSARVPSAVH